MPVYHSVVIEADGKDNGNEKAKTLYITPKIKPKNDRRGRFGTFPKVLLGCVFLLALLFLLASIAQYLYDNFGPKPDKSLETYDTVAHPQKDNRSDFSRFISSGLTIKFVAVILLAILGKYVWGED
ncbi:hypothetical protein CAEBREN_31078 [Caenorhabditis brenneri]|uniref:Uncharacterized protein n=1 Tax=Caenorhabditis brenneri TaxID=135651 RepID=G0NN77_CAEBE|nr:hypothetical protein CAEBREN_31078 [Caenorhabditis brenneri]